MSSKTSSSSKKADFNLHTNQLPYNKNPTVTAQIKTNLRKITLEERTYIPALLTNEVIKNAENLLKTNDPDKVYAFLVTQYNSYVLEKADDIDEIFLLKPRVTITQPILERSDWDHPLKLNVRSGLDQRSVGTSAKDDHAISVAIPESAHKENSKISFKEPDNFNYNNGLSELIKFYYEEISKKYKNMNDDIRHNVPPSQYNDAYQKTQLAKEAELCDKYPEVNDQDMYKLYHANKFSASNENRLDKWKNNFRLNYSTSENSISRERLKTPKGKKFIQYKKVSRDFAFSESLNKLFCIQLLRDNTDSPKAKEELNQIAERTMYQSRAAFCDIDAVLTKLSGEKPDTSFDPPNDIFKNFKENLPADISQEDKNRIVYNKLKETGITNGTQGVSSDISPQTLQKQQEDFISSTPKEFITNTDKLLDKIKKVIVAPLFKQEDRYDFKTSEARDYYYSLTHEKTKYSLPIHLADYIVKSGEIHWL